MKGPLFYAKILLFGEYGIIKDSKGLAIPFNSYKGVLKTAKNLTGEAKKSNDSLTAFYNYLKELETNKVSFDLESFKTDIVNGMYFDSSIPQGYGVGSSGALVASVYDKYAIDRITVLENLTRDKLLRLKDVFSLMESFFHGKSSGLDPLNSYLSLPTDACIEDFLHGNITSLFKNVKKLSKVVLVNFKPMIPKAFHKIWEKGIQTNDYYLKLCGSGGGGYILGFTEDFEKAKNSLKNYKLELVYRF